MGVTQIGLTQSSQVWGQPRGFAPTKHYILRLCVSPATVRTVFDYQQQNRGFRELRSKQDKSQQSPGRTLDDLKPGCSVDFSFLLAKLLGTGFLTPHPSALKLSEVLINQLTECSIALAVQKLIERAIKKIKETVATP